MKKILCFIYDTFADFETSLTCAGLNGDTYEVVYIAYDTSPVKSTGGLTIIPDMKVSELSNTPDIAGLIFPGGNNRIVKPELEKLVKQLDKEKKLLAAICAGPEYLAKIGILKGRKYTCTDGPEFYQENNEVDPFPRETYINTRMVREGNIITAIGDAFIDFSLEVWDWFNMYDSDSERDELKKLFTPT